VPGGVMSGTHMRFTGSRIWPVGHWGTVGVPPRESDVCAISQTAAKNGNEDCKRERKCQLVPHRPSFPVSPHLQASGESRTPMNCDSRLTGKPTLPIGRPLCNGEP
jgi:hypothetical protein